MHRLFALLVAFAVLLLPIAARPDAADIAAAARGVVRVVIMGTDGERVFPVSHGTGFAITPTRIVTNAHVVREALQDDTLRIAIVPPDGDGADYARILSVSSIKDLAVLEATGTMRLPALTIAGSAASDGDEVSAVGYPMNVDRAQGLDLSDLFRPQPPVKSRGFVSGTRPSRDFDTVLHTAAIARGNSGGPLLDGCGRVVGVNSFGTTSEDASDAEFSFAVSNRELLPFLKSAGIEPPVNAMPCRSMAQLDADERARMESEQSAARARMAQRAETDRERRERARLEAQMAVMGDRENAMALAAILILASIGAGVLSARLLRSSRERTEWSHAKSDRSLDETSGDDPDRALDAARRTRRYGVAAAILSASLALAASAVWITRPGIDAIDRRVADMMAEGSQSEEGSENPPSVAAAAALTCSIQPARSRIVIQPPEDLDFAWNPDGCVNGRTQYGFAEGRWTRLFVPNDEDTVSVNSFDPDTRTFRTDRFPLSQSAMAKARTARAAYTAPVCGADSAAANLGEMQSGVTALLPAQATERLVYTCVAKDS